jgi:TRAP-type mannitol/chloroaromatic compound transport system permease small subunit
LLLTEVAVSFWGVNIARALFDRIYLAFLTAYSFNTNAFVTVALVYEALSY